MLSEIKQLLSIETDRKQLSFNIIVDPNLKTEWFGDSFRIRQILLNLLGNAIRFTHEGEIDVSVKELLRINAEEAIIEFRVKDTGIGIPPNKIYEIFSEFSQADSSNTRMYGGTGLGLSISKGLISQMGGKIGAESQVGIGSVFSFTIKLSIGSSELQKQESLIEEVGIYASAINLLIAEDDATSRLLIERACIKNGWNVVFAETGLQALELYKNHKFDALVMDIQMPEMDGYEATKGIRLLESEFGTHTPIIALTAHAMAEDREKCIEAGMDDYISKPINLSSFYTTIVKWVQASTQQN